MSMRPVLILWIHMSIIWIYVKGRFRPAGHLVWPKLSAAYYTNFSTQFFFHTCRTYRHNWLLPFYTTFTDLVLCLGVIWSVQSKTSWLHFLTHFQLIRIKFGMECKQFKLNILILFLSKIKWNKGNNCCFTACIERLNISRHSRVCESIWFKISMTIDTIVLCVLKLV